MSFKNNPDLLLINPGNREQLYQKLGSDLAAIEPPIWVGLIATFVRNKGYSVQILDANAEGLGPVDTAQRIAEISPILTAIVVYGQNPSASTMVMPAVNSACKEIKKMVPEQKILLTGGHVAALPEQTLLEEDCDFVCDGEGPYTILELIAALKRGSTSLEKVRGLLYWKDSVIVHNESAPLVMDLDTEMEGIAWDLLPMDRYRAHNWHCFEDIDQRQPYASIYTTLGCPFRCSFCCIHAPFKSGEKVLGHSSEINTYRRWSPQSIVKQIDILVNDYGVKNIKFADEIFVLNKKHVLDICDLIIERGYGLNIWAYARVDSWSEEVLTKMKQAGINWICLGIESGNSHVCDDVHKGYKAKDVFSAVEAFRNAGIYIIANYLFGLPEDDMKSIQETLDLALNLNCEFANFYCAMAYPGSKLYDQAKEKGLALPENWTGYSQHAYDTLPLPTNHLDGPDVLKFRDRAFNSYFNNTKYHQMLSETFGYEIVEHVKKMASYKLKRKYIMEF
jgi:radical SAM superfamily enzyme YgiQ (UPF0313 family)|tara:strand:+ start:695 stop:2212 length:1518 start_codon:yes stop_codon:yes gene_type:complete